MTARQGFRVTSLTTGTPSHKFEHLRKNYVYGGDKRDDGGDDISAPLADSSAERRRRRLEQYQALAAERPALSLSEIARRMQLAQKTVRRYRDELSGPEARP